MVRHPFQVEPRPPHFIAPEEAISDLKSRLFGEMGPSPSITVIHGMGGLGKTTLALAIAHDREVRKRFPHGVLWARFGEEPLLLSLLKAWLRDLENRESGNDIHVNMSVVAKGGSTVSHITQQVALRELTPENADEASKRLQTLLQDSAALLILDNVWDSSHVRPFLVGSDRCRTIITSRRANIADELGGELYPLRTMTPEASLALMGHWLRRKIEGRERSKALQVAEAVGYLPMALSLAAARVLRRVPWETLFAAIEQEVARLEVLQGPHDTRRAETNLEASLNLSLDALHEEEPGAWSAFLWLAVVAEGAVLAPPMASTLWDVDKAEADRLLEKLWNDALLLSLAKQKVRIGGRSWPAYRIHDLLHDVAGRLLTATPAPKRPGDSPGLGIPLSEAHNIVLSRYLSRCKSGRWHRVHDDGYIHEHFTWHLQKAGRGNETHDLMQESTTSGRHGWFDACDRAGKMWVFEKDLNLARGLVGDGNRAARSAEAVALQCRYALITASLKSLSGNIPPVLLGRLVESRAWAPSQGLAYALQKIYPHDVADALIELSPHLAGPLRLTARDVASAMEDRTLRDRVLAALSREKPAEPPLTMGNIGYGSLDPTPVPGFTEPELLGVAHALARRRERQADLAKLHGAVWYPSQLGELMDELRLDYNYYMYMLSFRYREMLAGQLSYRLLGMGHQAESLGVARSIGDESLRAEALSQLVPHIAREERHGVVREALDAALAMREEKRARVLEQLAPHLSKAMISRALEAVGELDDASDRAESLAALVPCIARAERYRVARAALRAALSMRASYLRYHYLHRVVARLAPYLTMSSLRELFNDVEAHPTDCDAAFVLKALGPQLPEALLRRALAIARRIEEGARSSVLADLVPRLAELGYPDEALEEVLRDLAMTGDWSHGGPSALRALVPKLPRRLLRRALYATRIGDEISLSGALSGLASELAKSGHTDLIPEALEAMMGSGRPGLEALALLAPYETARRMPDILEAIQRHECEDLKADALVALAPHVPPHDLPKLLEYVRDFIHPAYKGGVLVAVAPTLPLSSADSYLDVLQTAMAHRRDEAMLALVVRLFELGADEAATTILKDLRINTNNLPALIKYIRELPPTQRDDSVRSALAHVGTDWESRAWEIAPMAALLTKPTRRKVIKAIFNPGGGVSLAPDAFRWLAPFLTVSQVRQAIHMIQRSTEHSISDELGDVLAPLALRLVELGREEEALGVARSIRWFNPLNPVTDDIHAKVLETIVPVLSAARLTEALEIALKLRPSHRDAAMRELSLRLARVRRSDAIPQWDKILDNMSHCERYEVLTGIRALAPLIVALSGAQGAIRTFRTIQEVGRWWP
jgi:hypothetical protein